MIITNTIPNTIKVDVITDSSKRSLHIYILQFYPPFWKLKKKSMFHQKFIKMSFMHKAFVPIQEDKRL